MKIHFFKICKHRGAWVALSVERLTLDFGSGRDLTVVGSSPASGPTVVSTEPVWDSLSLCPSSARALFLSK